MPAEMITALVAVLATALLAFIGYLASNAFNGVKQVAQEAAAKGDDLEKQLMSHQMDALKQQIANNDTFVKRGDLTTVLADLFKKIDNMDTKIDKRLDGMDRKLDDKQDKAWEGKGDRRQHVKEET